VKGPCRPTTGAAHVCIKPKAYRLPDLRPAVCPIWASFSHLWAFATSHQMTCLTTVMTHEWHGCLDILVPPLVMSPASCIAGDVHWRLAVRNIIAILMSTSRPSSPYNRLCQYSTEGAVCHVAVWNRSLAKLLDHQCDVRVASTDTLSMTDGKLGV